MALSLVITVGCGASQAKPEQPVLKPGDLPTEGEWSGVYYSTVEGYLHIAKDGNAVQGRWRKKSGEEWGELHGEVVGDLLRYEWTAHIIGQVGPGAKRGGKGYFRYVVPKGDGVAHELHGSYGLGDDMTATKWEAVKQKNQVPDFASVMPDEVETSGGPSGGWDEEEGGGEEEEEGGEDEEGGDDEGDPLDNP